MKLKQILSLFTVLSFVFTYSCKKNKILTSSVYNISTSTDTLLFDTIFTTIGSTTKRFKCYNKNSGTINISTISLLDGENSQFRINVDGESGVLFNDIAILPGDSLFIFVEVTIDPNGSQLPLIVEDEIVFETNGNSKKIILNAWGQDAYFHVNEIVQGIWRNDKPHVIYGLAAVGYPSLDSNLTLTIEEGTKVHGHSNGVLYVYKSSLIVNGNLNNPVIFQQDRMEDYLLYPADSIAGQWRGIYFSSALNSNISHAEIKNAIIGIQVDTFTINNTISLNKVKVNNSLYSNILTQGSNVNATNCLFGNSDNYSAIISIGGKVNFDHCTFSNYFNGFRSTPSFLFKDYYKTINEQLIYRPFDVANFTNCIFDGNASTDFNCDTLGYDLTGLKTNVLFDYCSIKTEDTVTSSIFSNCFFNLKTHFNNTNNWNFELTGASEVIDLGKSSLISDDILDRLRSIPNDLGCYEYI
ncbi:MAG: hypothetical protein ISQ95_00465 [Flavobacteriales bacterium]|nr:hypothetical protein [Flavobacteriales bacterium]